MWQNHYESQSGCRVVDHCLLYLLTTRLTLDRRRRALRQAAAHHEHARSLRQHARRRRRRPASLPLSPPSPSCKACTTDFACFAPPASALTRRCACARLGAGGGAAAAGTAAAALAAALVEKEKYKTDGTILSEHNAGQRRAKAKAAGQLGACAYLVLAPPSSPQRMHGFTLLGWCGRYHPPSARHRARAADGSFASGSSPRR